MWTKWVILHHSYGLPRVAMECRTYLENRGIRVKLRMGRSKRATSKYYLLVPKGQKAQAEAHLADFRKGLD